MLIPFNPREKSSSRVPLFLTLRYPPGLIEPRSLLYLLDNPLYGGFSDYKRSKLLNY